jgi:hypothetical protein
VGGYGGEIRAQTPEAAWAKFDREIRPEAEEHFGLFLVAPLSREQAFKSIWQDPQTQAWVLDYYFSK